MRSHITRLPWLLLCYAISSLSDEQEECFVSKPVATAHAVGNSLLQLKQRVASKKVDSQRDRAIPPHLVMTGPYASIDDFPQAVAENLRITRGKNPELSIRYFSDAQCSTYLKEYLGDEYREIYDNEPTGSFRGDICRAAVLLREGGFYMDLDFLLHVPLNSLIDERTTLMTAWCDPATSGNTILNAIMGVKPDSPVMKGVLERLLLWYHGPKKRRGLPGPVVTAEVLEELAKRDCPKEIDAVTGERSLKREQWTCGAENLRIYREEYFGSGQSCTREGVIVCPLERAVSPLHGAGFGVFRVGTESREARLIGWPRYPSCNQDGCGITHTRLDIPPLIPQPQATYATQGDPSTDKLPKSSKESAPAQEAKPEAAPIASREASQPQQRAGHRAVPSNDKWQALRRRLEEERKSAWSSFSSTAPHSKATISQSDIDENLRAVDANDVSHKAIDKLRRTLEKEEADSWGDYSSRLKEIADETH